MGSVTSAPRFMASRVPGRAGVASARGERGRHGPARGLRRGAAVRPRRTDSAQLPARPMLTSPSGPVRVSRASVRRVPSTKATRRGRSASVARCATNAPPSSTSSHSTACGEVVRRLEAGPVGGVEGLDADGAGPVCRVSGALHPPQVRCVPAVLSLRAYDDAVTDHDSPKADP